jgi:hypothetical protein
VILRLGALACRQLEQRSEFVLERADLFDQAGAVAVLSVLVPGGERSGCDLQAGLAELFLGGESWLWALKSRTRCAQQSWRCSGLR